MERSIRTSSNWTIRLKEEASGDHQVISRQGIATI